MLSIGRMATLIVPLSVGLLIGYVWGASAKERSQAMAAEGANNPSACCKTSDAGDKPQGGCCPSKKDAAAVQAGSNAEAKAPESCCKTVGVTEKPQGGCCSAKKAAAVEDGPAAEAKTAPTCCKPINMTEMPQGGCCGAKKATAPAEAAE